ncbi:DsbA family protein [Actinomadura luteofluorescens]
MSGRARILAGAVVAALVLVGLTVATLTGRDDRPPTAGEPGGIETIEAPSTSSPTTTPAVTPTVAGPEPPPSDPALRLGAQTAPVTIVEFGDFQCPNCGHFARDLKPALVRKYVDTGVVRIYWRDFPAFGKESMRAAVAARAASRQGRFWDFHDELYAHQPPLRSGRITDDYLRGVARKLGLDVARFDADRRGKAVRTAVNDDFGFGQALGVPGTPAFLINGEPFFGAQPLPAFEKAIGKARTAS